MTWKIGAQFKAGFKFGDANVNFEYASLSAKTTGRTMALTKA